MTTTPLVASPAPDIPGPALAHLATMPMVNLMPPEIVEQAALVGLRRRCVLALGVSAAVVAGLFVLAAGGVHAARSGLHAEQARTQGVQKQVDALAPVGTTYAAVAAQRALINQALGGEVRWSQQLAHLSRSMPPGIVLTGMTVAAPTATADGGTAGVATITFNGVAANRNDLAGWLDTLTKDPDFADAYYSSSVEQATNNKVTVTFSSSVTATDAALSGRWTTTGAN